MSDNITRFIEFLTKIKDKATLRINVIKNTEDVLNEMHRLIMSDSHNTIIALSEDDKRELKEKIVELVSVHSKEDYKSVVMSLSDEGLSHYYDKIYELAKTMNLQDLLKRVYNQIPFRKFIVEAKHWNDIKISTPHCNFFVKDFLTNLGNKVVDGITTEDKVVDDIITTDMDADYRANVMHTKWPSNPNLINLGNTEDSAKEAQYYATNKYLVLATMHDTPSGHVAIVGPQDLEYTDEIGGFEGKTGEDGSQNRKVAKVLFDYPVFVQAGGYRGVIPPRYAFGKNAFTNNKVSFFLYSPVSEHRK